jgi:hypothetical protein
VEGRWGRGERPVLVVGRVGGARGRDEEGRGASHLLLLLLVVVVLLVGGVLLLVGGVVVVLLLLWLLPVDGIGR